MKALRLTRVGDAGLEEVRRPDADGDVVVIEVERAGVCGTDLEILRGDFPSTPPVTMGHEYAGVVSAVGKSVRTVHPGDRVSSAGAWGCGECEQCLAGRPAYCPNRRMLGASADGAFAESVSVPERAIIPLPEGVAADAGQSLITLAVALRAVRRVPAAYAVRVAVLGPGHLGVILLQVLRRVFGGRVSMFGTRRERLQIAAGAAEEIVNVREQDLESHSGRFDLVFDAAGTPSSFTQALELAAPGGIVSVLGVSDVPVPEFHSSVLYEKELTILGSKGGSGEYAEAARLLADGEVEVEPLITHRFPLERGVEALAAAGDRDSGSLRVVIEPR